jgi:hypothetical protein
MAGPMNVLSAVAWVALAALLAACHGAGPYGHSPQYAPSGDEDSIVAGAREYDPVMVGRQPDEWRKGKVVVFGVVDRRAPGPGGQALLTLSVRRLELRNLCENANDDDTCRVTVSDKDFGVVHALVSLRGDDDVGPRSVGLRSLMRIVGPSGRTRRPPTAAA